MNKKILITIIGLSILDSSCNSESKSDTYVFHDAYIQTKNISGIEKHSIAFNVIAYNNIQSASVTNPGNIKTDLQANGNNNTNFINKYKTYSTEIPPAGTYNFETIIKGEDPKTDSDNLSDTHISTPNILSADVKQMNQETLLEVILQQKKEVSRYRIELIDKDRNVIFSSDPFRVEYDGNSMKQNITKRIYNPLSGAGLKGWINKNLYITDAIEVKITAMRFEDKALDNLLANIQAISESNKIIKQLK